MSDADQDKEHAETASFAQVTMFGAEFEGGKIPIRSLDELSRYQYLVLKAALSEWESDHPNESVPDDFESAFDLVLSDIQEGSAVSVLERPSTSTYDDYFNRGRDTLELELQLANSEDKSVVNDISLLKFPEFSDLGSSLHDGERMEIRAPRTMDRPENVISITRATSHRVKRSLVPSFRKSINPRRSETTWIVGRLTAVNADKKNFTISSDPHGTINGKYRDEEILDDLKAVLNSSERAPVVRLFADLRFAGTRLDRILDVYRVQVLEIDGQPWSRRFVELAQLERGWDEEDEESAIVSFIALDGARQLLLHVQQLGMPQPGIFPTADGGVSLEWATAAQVVTIDITDNAEFGLFQLTHGSEPFDTTTKNLSEVCDFIDRVEIEQS